MKRPTPQEYLEAARKFAELPAVKRELARLRKPGEDGMPPLKTQTDPLTGKPVPSG